jgi:hypothetical protein
MCRWNCNWNRNCCMCRGCRWENQCGSWCGNRCCNYWENQCGRQQENRCENRCSEQRENRCENRCGEQRENQCGRQQENRCGNGWCNPWAANEVCRMCYNQGFTAGFAAGTVRTAQENQKNIYRHTMEQQTKAMNQKANAHFENLCNTKCNTKEKVLE